MNCSIIIPAYNEEARIQKTVEEYAAFFQKEPNPGETEILIVVNGSNDRTADIAKELEQQISFVRAFEFKEKLGKGGALLKGFDLCESKLLAFTDADNSTTAPELKKLLDAVKGGVDAAIGSRWLPESKQAIRQPVLRRAASRVFNGIVRLLFQMPYKDTQCGAKAFHRDAFRSVQDGIQSTGWAFDVEFIWRLRLKGYNVVEIPIVWSDNSNSRLRMHKDAPSMLWELIKLRFGKK